MRDLGRALSVFAPLLLAAATRGQGYPALEIDGLAGVSYVGGNSIASAGDVDGDGVADLIVGAPYTFSQIGQARIYSGATGALLRLFTGSVPQDYFGNAVSGAGDLDADGLDDVVVGVIHASPGGLTAAGQAIAYSGATGAVLWTRNGTVAFEMAGYSVARVGDLNGDGVEDPAIGIVYADNGPAFAAGRVEVVSGTTGVPILSVLGAGLGDNLGASLAAAGDVNGDGTPDILAGAPGGTLPGLLNAGSVRLISGATGATLLQLQGIAAGDKLGTSVAGVGDASGDGVPDLFAGAPEPNNNGNGYVRLYSGATGAILFTLASTLLFEEFGSSVAGAGDLSGDGVPDLLVGAPKALGAPGIPQNTAAGRVQALTGLGGAPLFNVVGTNANGALGTSVAGLGDVNGDGTPDFLSGEPGALGSGGQAQVRSGTSGAPIFTFQGQETGDQFGRAAAAVGDVDGDGREDLVVGAPSADAGFIPNSGRATLHSSATGSALATLDGPASGANLGSAVAGLGDVDGDGVPDFAAGSPAENLAAGVVRVVSGATGATLLVLNGSTFGDQFGFSVAGTGDLDGDGVPDLVTGAPQGQSINVFAQGYARAHSGATGAVLGSFGGGGFSGRMGTSVAGIVDASGDGVPDVAVGAPAGAGFLSPPSPGLVRVFSGSGGGLIREIVGTFVSERFGASVAPAGDVDGDGLADVIVGAPDLSLPGASFIGGAAVYSVATGATLFGFLGQAAYERLGTCVGGGRDLDGDGAEDFLLGVPGGPGSAPPLPGEVRIRSGATGAPLLTLSGSAPGEEFGSVVVPMGDATGDGVPDVLATSPLADPVGLPDAGRARVLSLVGLPAAATPFGSACAGTGGFAPAISTFGGDPAPGNAAFGISIARGRGGAPALLFLGSMADPLGVPVLGCNIHLAGAIFPFPQAVLLGGAAGAGGEGFRLLRLGVPPDPSLSGAQVHLQWIVVDAGGANGLFAASAALTLAIP
jgi:FG-GAP repeat protein